jgi:hypothetical protein
MNQDFEDILSGIFFTCYDNDLIPIDAGGGDMAIVQSEEDLLAVAGSSAFLPRVQLFGSSSDAAKEGKIPVAHWGLVRGKDQLEDLGKEFNCLVITGRVKALDLSGEQIVTSYDHKSDTFKSIQERSATSESKCMYGPEFLIYVPDSKTYATVFLSSKTARGEARSLHARLRKAATFKSQLIEGKRFKWHGPVFTPCSTPFDLPPVEEIKEQADKFLKPQTDGPELAPTGDAAGAGERAR